MLTQIAHYPKYDEARDNNEIELRIKPLTDALYEFGVHPLASCEGHRGYFYPYVSFFCTQDVASTISRITTHANMECSFYWGLTGHFTVEASHIIWRLSPNTDQIGRRIWGLRSYRKRLIEDIEVIRNALCIKQIQPRENMIKGIFNARHHQETQQ